jgi:excisionase family DNA binding protein
MTVLTHQEAAAFLKVNDATLRKLRRRGDIHGTLVGAQYRYLREHLEDYL